MDLPDNEESGYTQPEHPARPEPATFTNDKGAFEETWRSLDSLLAALDGFTSAESVRESLPVHWQSQLDFIKKRARAAEDVLSKHRSKRVQEQDEPDPYQNGLL